MPAMLGRTMQYGFSLAALLVVLLARPAAAQLGHEMVQEDSLLSHHALNGEMVAELRPGLSWEGARRFARHDLKSRLNVYSPDANFDERLWDVQPPESWPAAGVPRIAWPPPMPAGITLAAAGLPMMTDYSVRRRLPPAEQVLVDKYGRWGDPRSPAPSLRPPALVDALRAMTHEAARLNGIRSDSVAGVMLGWLDEAHGQLTRHQDREARVTLNRFLLALRERLQPALSDGVYALVHWNTAFVRDRLPAPENDYGLLPLPYLRDVVIRVDVQHDPDHGFYYYHYSVENGALSDGSVAGIEIDIASDSLRAQFYPEGLQFKDEATKGSFMGLYAGLRGKVVPVGLPSFPPYWHAGLTPQETVLFGGSIVRPGQVQDGFILMAEALPGIRDYKIMPRYEPKDHYPPNVQLQDEEFEAVDSLVRLDRASRLPVQGKTIGPVAPPRRFDPYRFIDMLRSYTKRSRQLGWIKDAAVEDELMEQFREVDMYLRAQDRKMLRRSLNDLLAHIALERYGSLTPEAYALLRYNTQYLYQRVVQ